MSLSDQILLRLFFPEYEARNKTRFEKLFKSIEDKNKINNIESDPEINESDKIFPEKIVQSLDKRSSVILTKVPVEIKKNVIRDILESFGNINYLHMNFSRTHLYKTVYVNFVNYKTIVSIYMFLRKIKSDSKTNININKNKTTNESEKILNNVEIFYSKFQGKNELKARFGVKKNKH